MKKLTYQDKNGYWCDATYTTIKTVFRDCYSEIGTFTGNKLQAIKNFKNKTDTGLKEAKEFVDTICHIQVLKRWNEYLPTSHIISGMQYSFNAKDDEDELEEIFEPIEEFMYG